MTTANSEIWNPTAQEEAAFKATDETFLWLCALPMELIREFSGKWIAARDKKIIASSETFDALLTQINGVDLQSIIIDRIERPGWMVYR